MKIALLLVSVLATTEAFAEVSQARDNISFAIEQASDICLSGTKYKLELDGEGKLNILRIQPGGKLSAVVEVQRSKGGVDFNDEKIREVFDKKPAIA